MHYLGLPSLKYRRRRGDMIIVYKIINGLSKLDWRNFLTKVTADRTRQSEYKLYIEYSRTNTRKNVFSNRTAPIWNSLSDKTKSAKIVNQLKNLLDNDTQIFMYTFISTTNHTVNIQSKMACR